MKTGFVKTGFVKAEKAYRVVATGVGWLFFGLLALGGGRAGRIYEWIGHPEPDLPMQRIVCGLFRLWERFASRVGVIRVHWTGLDQLVSDEPRIYVANHPTLIDAVLVLARMSQGDVVVSENHARNWVLRDAAAVAQYTPAGAGARLVDICCERLRKGRSLLLFPEGTRSPAEGFGHFHRAAAHLAARTGCDLVPIAISVVPPMLRKGQKWYKVPPSRGEFQLRVLPPISAKRFWDDNRSAGVNARVLMEEVRRVLRDAVEGHSR
ncbi:MAG: 1-acyl-sn-glycerol-3-phosphate acyltransferase [Myxococcales bacterium]|nr:1-acyl-sn-glycerol-3-phosphate acyltransferase [Myxococcales bacterium]